ncbi:beta-L-arabinofuranosidase domain-containing protein [Saccharicrinis sp. FJH62]|uniref:beta-L-arabinofuranosidase domain-containing protein n=1 Tax=Saccharicrinis sp. FJH62 TaxID=3344657 RepID=UPI0035D42B79
MILIVTISVSAQNTNYVSNKVPLISTPFTDLPLGSIKAEGWLKTQLENQKTGLTGYSEEIYSELGSNAAWLGGDAPESDWERPTYYVRGLVDLAYVLNDPELKTQAQKWIDWALNSQKEDGSFGPASNDDWWPRMPMIIALMDYYSATTDDRVIPFLTNYFQYQLNTLSSRPLRDWGKTRAADNVEVIFWLYNRTGDSFLLDLADKIRTQTFNYASIFSKNTFLTQYHSNFYPKHGVNVAEAYKYAPVFYQRSGTESDRDAFLKGIENLAPYHTQITGMNSCTEFLSGNSSIQGVELCATVERMYCNEIATRILGDAAIGDELEKIAFNQLPAAFTEDIHQLQYYTLPNQVQSKQGGNGFGQDYDNAVLPGPYSGYPCCRFNMHFGWPKYAQYAWMATADNGLAATAYAPTVVTAKVSDGKDVIITESTNYPFEEQIIFTVKTARDVAFPLQLRIPAWCDNPEIKVNDEVLSDVIPGAYKTISRTWKDSDIVVLNLPMKLKTSTWVNNSVGIERGPLVFSLKLKENRMVKNAHSFSGKDFSEYEVYGENAWNYGLIIDRDHPENSLTVEQKEMPENPFAQDSTPVQLKVKARQIPSWGLTQWGVHAAEPPYSPVSSDAQEEEVTLIPFGSERIRVTYFPVIGKPESAISDIFQDDFQSREPNKWVNFAGGWQPQDGMYYAESYNLKGAKSVAMNTDFADFTYDATVMILNDETEAGVIFRVSDPAIGVDTYKGYYAGISTNGKIILGKSNNGWSAIKIIDGTINKSTAYHLRAVTNGSRINFYVDDMEQPKIVANDATYSHGAIGLRQYCGTNTSDPSGQTIIFKDVKAVSSDYTALNEMNIKTEGYVTIYPNPTGDSFLVKSTTGFDRFYISGMAGKVLKSDKFDHLNLSTEIDVSDLDSGSYFICLSGENYTQTRTFIKK